MSHLQPHRLQLHALEQLHTNLSDSGRGVVVMPCGAGKTLLGRWFAEQIRAELAVVFVPSLALVPQTLIAYRSDPSWRHSSMLVCSDDTTGRAVQLADLDVPDWARHEIGSSTSAHLVADFLTATPGARLIVSTYHSAPRVAAALQATGLVADLAVCDEAHRLSGRPRREFRSVLEDDALPARRRVFLTATPVEAAALADECDEQAAQPLSLDDKSVFGPTLYRASFADAVAAGRLVDYDVQVLARRPVDIESNADGRPAHDPGALAVLSAARDGAGRILTFHTRVNHARKLAEALDGHRLPDGRVIRAEHLQSRHTATRRTAALDRLASTTPGTVRVLASARVLTEGVDVPAVDTVVFADPRRSPVDVVQAVGRAMRTAPGKRRGRVVLAATFDDNGLDEDTALGATGWRHVWATLRALADMDERFAARLRGKLTPGGSGGCRPGPVFGPGLELDLPDGIDVDRWQLRAIDVTGGTWWRRFEALAAHARQQGAARPDRDTVQDGIAIGRWVRYQRTAHNNGSLSADRAEALERLPGWAWSARETAWWNAAEVWARWHALRRNTKLTGPQRWTALAETDARSKVHGSTHFYDTLAEWAVDTTGRRRRGELPGHLERAAERLVDWSWSLLDADDERMIDALAEYGAWKHDLNPAHDYRHDDDLPLGPWLTAVRRRRVTGRLDPLLEYSLELLGRPSNVQALRWDTPETRWRLGYLALRQFVTREGTCRIPYQHTEALPDFELNLSRWATIQRQDHRRGLIDPQRETALEQVPGWAWEVSPNQSDIDIPVELHGQRAGYAKGCRCEPCVQAHAGAYNGKHRAAGLPADLVDARPAREHIENLLRAGLTKDAIGRASGLNPKTADDVVDGNRARIRPETAAALLAITAEAAAKHDRSAFGPHGELVDAGPTWELLDWMVMRGWPKSWISREIGQGGRALQLKRDRISKANADKVAELDRRLGRTRRPPKRGINRNGTCPPLPTLEELLAAEGEVAS